MNREYHKWWSPRLNREMELLVFGHAGAKVLVFPTRDGRFFEYENLGMTEVLRPKIEAGHLQLFCVDAIYDESFYCWWRIPAGGCGGIWNSNRMCWTRCFPSCMGKIPIRA